MAQGWLCLSERRCGQKLRERYPGKGINIYPRCWKSYYSYAAAKPAALAAIQVRYRGIFVIDHLLFLKECNYIVNYRERIVDCTTGETK